jgi:hypothetical protein
VVDRREAGALAVLAVAGAFVAFWRLSTPGWGVDEVIYAEAAGAYAAGEFVLNRGHAWLAKELMGLSILAFGDGELGARLPGTLLGFLTGFVLWALARRLAGTVSGVVAAGLWWLLPLSPGTTVIRLDRYGILEPPMVFFATLALLFAVDGRWPPACAWGSRRRRSSPARQSRPRSRSRRSGWRGRSCGGSRTWRPWAPRRLPA